MNGVEASVPRGPRFATATDRDRKHRISLKAMRPKETSGGHTRIDLTVVPSVIDLNDVVRGDGASKLWRRPTELLVHVVAGMSLIILLLMWLTGNLGGPGRLRAPRVRVATAIATDART